MFVVCVNDGRPQGSWVTPGDSVMSGESDGIRGMVMVDTSDTGNAGGLCDGVSHNVC